MTKLIMKANAFTNALVGLLLVAATASMTACVETVDAQTPSANAPVPCGATPTPATPATMFQDLQPPPPYLIGKADVVDIVVSPEVGLDERRCSKAYTVGPDGKISNFCQLPTGVQADGLTVQQLEQEIKDQLIKSGQYTTVTVGAEIKEYRSQSVYVQGPVQTPGAVTLKGKELTIMRAIHAANSWAVNAGTEVWLLRPPANSGITNMTMDSPVGDKTRYLRKDLVDNRIDPSIQAGDTIFVTNAEVFWINGEVKSGSQKVFEECMTLFDAISLAGGLTDRGSIGRSYIQRKNSKGDYVQIKNLKDATPIEPRDTINIGRKLF